MVILFTWKPNVFIDVVLLKLESRSEVIAFWKFEIKIDPDLF